MKTKPYVLVKFAMSIDGYIDDITSERLILSDATDFDRVDAERAECDAILLGADAVRKDNPRLLIRSESRKKERLAKGMSENLIKVTVTSSGNLSKELKFFTVGNSKKIVYCGINAKASLLSRIGDLAEIVPSPTTMVNPEFILEDLAEKGVHKLMIEGGSQILTMFLSKGLVDEIQVSVAPFFVGDSNAPRFVNAASFIHDKNNRMKLDKVEMVGDMALLTYKLATINNNYYKKDDVV